MITGRFVEVHAMSSSVIERFSCILLALGNIFVLQDPESGLEPDPDVFDRIRTFLSGSGNGSDPTRSGSDQIRIRNTA